MFMRMGLIVMALALISGSSCQKRRPEAYDAARKRMVEKQIMARGIEDDRVITAMLKVERHRFVPEKYRHYAYSDSPVPIGNGQTISQPNIVALMT